MQASRNDQTNALGRKNVFEYNEMTKFINFSTIKGMTVTKKLQKAFGGPPKCLY